MKELPEYEPRRNSWEKIMQRKDFDSQLSQNLNELPIYSPSELVWNRIEEELGKKKKTFIWWPLLIAASVSCLLFLAFYQYDQSDEQTQSLKQADGINIQNLTPENKEKGETELDYLAGVKKDSSSYEVIDGEKRKIDRTKEFIPEIAVEKQLGLVNSFIVKGMDLETRGKPIDSSEMLNKTFHTVAISWDIRNTKVRLTTKIGAPDPLLLEAKNKEEIYPKGQIRLGQRNIIDFK